jgi:hypothetical protein
MRRSAASVRCCARSGKAHADAMIVMRIDRRAVQGLSAIKREAVVVLFNLCAHFAEFPGHNCDAICLFDAQFGGITHPR